MGSVRGARAVAGTTVAVVVLAVLAGCSAGDQPPVAVPTTTTPAAPSTGSSESGDQPAPSAPAEPRPTRYRPHPAEVDGGAKRTAARAVERLRRVRQVTYTQYFGYVPPSASILVEADFAGGGGTTYDVRISRSDRGWEVDGITPAAKVRRLPDPGRLIRRVLDSERIDLPWAGRRDVASGRVAESVLRSLLAVSRRHRIGVSVLIAAHPELVFGTDRRSRHPDGFAYDIGSVDGRLVVDPGARALVRRLMRTAAGTGAGQVGGPEDLDGPGSQYFSDPTHSDHVHVGFDG